MHETQLAFDYAVGNKNQVVGKQEVNTFPESVELRKKSISSAKYLMEKKAKARYANYVKLMSKSGRTAKKPLLPNSTRAAGTYLHYSSMVESRWNLNVYYRDEGSNVPEEQQLSNESFIMIAQFACILYPISVVLKVVQTDKAGSLAYTYLHIYRCFVGYVFNNKWWVANVDNRNNPDTITRWNASAAWPQRDYLGTPVELSSRKDTEVVGSLDKIGLV
jgi:hypothetical protein